MKGTIVIALAATALTTSALTADAFASQAGAQHRSARGQTHARHLPRVFEHTYGAATRPAPQSQSPGDRYQNIYQSDAQAHQEYANPDRTFPPPDLQ